MNRLTTAIAIVMIAFSAACPAGPVATLHLDDGKTVRGEILSMTQGMFRVRDIDSGHTIAIPDNRLSAIDFGPQPDIRRPRPPTVDADTQSFWRTVEQQDIEALMWRQTWVRHEAGDTPLLEFKEQILEEKSKPDLPQERRRYLDLALIVTLFSLEDTEAGLSEIRKLAAAHPKDAVVRAFLKLVRQMREGDAQPLWEASRKNDEGRRLSWRVLWAYKAGHGDTVDAFAAEIARQLGQGATLSRREQRALIRAQQVVEKAKDLLRPASDTAPDADTLPPTDTDETREDDEFKIQP